MSLDLKKYRTAHHERLAVGGSYTDTWIESFADSATSSGTLAAVRWVPNDKGGSGYYTGTSTTQLSTYGYLQYTLSINAMYLLRFRYYDDTNAYNGGSTSPGVALVAVNGYEASEEGANQLADMINDIHSDVYGDSIYVICTKGKVCSSPQLNDVMKASCKSWRWSLTKGSNTTVTDHTYTAVGTNINDIGFLSEAIAGPGSLHSGAVSELVIEHSKQTLGHAGYGEEMSSGLGNGSAYLNMSTGTYETTIGWSNADKRHVSQDEYVRATFETKIGAGARYWGGYCRVTLDEVDSNNNVLSTVTNTTSEQKNVDGWAKQELKLAKTTANSSLKIKVIADDGSGSGTGPSSGYEAIDIKNLNVFKCGFQPDAQRDAAVHKFHINGLNVEESPGPFRIGAPDEFVTFWNSSRNLAGNSTSYTSTTTNSSTANAPELRPMHFQYIKSGTTNASQGPYNWINWFNRQFSGASDQNSSQTYGWVHEVYSATVNDTYDVGIGPSGGITVDHNKLYVAGVWLKVRRNTHTNTTLAPNRISMVAGTQNPGAFISSYGTTSTLLAHGTNYQQSIYADNFALDNVRQNWKLLSGFYLPSWMTATERAAWKDDYWGTWAGHFEHGEGSSADINMSGLTGYGLNTANAGYVAGMQNTTTKIKPIIRVEQYQSTDLWAEFMYPFVIEIDPMNINDEGNIYFWDFQENLPT